MFDEDEIHLAGQRLPAEAADMLVSEELVVADVAENDG